MGGGKRLRANMYDVRWSCGTGVWEDERCGDSEGGDSAAGAAAAAPAAEPKTPVVVDATDGRVNATLAICDDVEAGTRTPALGSRAVAAAETEVAKAEAVGDVVDGGALAREGVGVTGDERSGGGRW